MCRGNLHGFLQALPKCEHHMHVEGSLAPATLFQLARRNGVALPDAAVDPSYESEAALLQRYTRFTSLDDFLAYYYRAMAVLIHQQDFDDLAWAYLQRAHADGVVHAEIFFDPQAHMERDIAFSTVVTGLKAACLRAEVELKMTTQLICCFLRHLPASDALSLLRSTELTESFRRGDFVGIGLDSSEKGFPPELFVDVYKEAKQLGLAVTAHAGEEGPAVNIAKSISALGCGRIDHGIKLAADSALLQSVASSNTLLTVCPLSNVALRCVQKIGDLPIRQFLDSGVKFSINSDDPTYLGGFILDNYCAVQEAFNLSVSEWNTICLNAIEGSWCSPMRKEEMKTLLARVVDSV